MSCIARRNSRPKSASQSMVCACVYVSVYIYIYTHTYNSHTYTTPCHLQEGVHAQEVLLNRSWVCAYMYMCLYIYTHTHTYNSHTHTTHRHTHDALRFAGRSSRPRSTSQSIVCSAMRLLTPLTWPNSTRLRASSSTRTWPWEILWAWSRWDTHIFRI